MTRSFAAARHFYFYVFSLCYLSLFWAERIRPVHADLFPTHLHQLALGLEGTIHPRLPERILEEHISIMIDRASLQISQHRFAFGAHQNRHGFDLRCGGDWT
jgi:hypothetical protein